jgi:hypothetical protein
MLAAHVNINHLINFSSDKPFGQIHIHVCRVELWQASTTLCPTIKAPAATIGSVTYFTAGNKRYVGGFRVVLLLHCNKLS